MLSDANSWSSSTRKTYSRAPSPERCHSPASPSGELTEIEKLAILVRQIVQRRSRLSLEDPKLHVEMKRENEARLICAVPSSYSLPRGRSIKHQILREDGVTLPTECSAFDILSPRMSHNYGTPKLGSEPADRVNGTWPRNCRGTATHLSTVENTVFTAANHINQHLTATSVPTKSKLPSLHRNAISDTNFERETSNSAPKQRTEWHSPRIVEIPVLKRPRKTAFNASQGFRSNFQARKPIATPVLDASSCGAPKYQTTQNAESERLQARRHFDVALNVNTGLTTVTEDAGKENQDFNNNNTVLSDLPHAKILPVWREDEKSGDPVAVSASLVITYPFVRRALSIDNPYRRMICNPAEVCSSSRPSLRRTLSSEESRRKADGKTCISSHTKPPIHRSNSCLAAFGQTCLPISNRPKISASNHGRTWYDGV